MSVFLTKITCKGTWRHTIKKFIIFPSPGGISLTKLSLAGNYKFPARESLVSDIPAGDGKNDKYFYSACLFLSEAPRGW